MLLIFIATAFFIGSVNAQDLNNSINGTSNQKTQLTMCWIWEDDTYFAEYRRVAAAVDLAVLHVNNFILPDTHSIRVVYQSSGTSCTRTMYSVVDHV